MKQRPDFGTHTEDGLSCRYMAPGLTMHDIMRVFVDAEAEWKPVDDLSANPSKWKNFRGVTAVVDAVVEALVAQGTEQRTSNAQVAGSIPAERTN